MISIIIPAYNAAQYLDRAVKSIIGDGKYNDEIEILIIENNSTDNTTQVAENLANSYSNIKVLHSEKGVSNARNYGIKHAKGEWIAFVDADDYLLIDGLNVMLQDSLVKNCDLFLYGHEAGNTKKLVTDIEKGESFSTENIQNLRVTMLENPTKYMQVWAKLFKKELIDINNIYFDEELRLSEDSDFVIRYSKKCRKIILSNAVTYHYSIDNISTMRGSSGDKTRDYVLAMERTSEKLQHEDEKIVKAFQKYCLMHLNIALVRDVFDASNTNSRSDKIKKMKALAKESIFDNALSEVTVKGNLSLRMIPILCLKYHFYAISALVYELRANMNRKRESQ